MKIITDFIGSIAGYITDYVLIAILIIGGLWFTFRTKLVQFRLLGEQFRAVTEKPKDKEGVSSFQALMVSTASRVGTGNIIGVSTAICVGGYGAVFWMWVIAIIGSASAFVESTLAQIYKRKGPDSSYGGPAYYIKTALKKNWLAILFSVLLILTYAVGFNMLASFNLQSTFSGYSFYNEATTPWVIGGIIAVLVAFCLFGGGKRLLKVTSVLVPVMGVIYILAAVIALVLNISFIPDIFVNIFKDAFNFKAIFGGFGGSCMIMGIKRGLFSNEAGVGSAPNASASADVSHPVKQGLVQVLSVFIDTLLVCSATAFMCLSSGVEPTEAISGAAYVQQSLQTVFGDFGPILITVAMILFAFTTLLGNLYYVDKAIFFILGRAPSRSINTVYYIAASLLVFVGAGLNAGLLWNLADLFMAFMTIINIPVIIILGKYAFRALKDYEKQRKAGKDPVFLARNIGLPHDVDYWK